MTVADAHGSQTAETERWYARSPDEVATGLGVDPAAGLSAARAAELLASGGPNALPEGKPFAVGLTMMLVFTLIGLVLGILLPRRPIEATAAQSPGPEPAARHPG